MQAGTRGNAAEENSRVAEHFFMKLEAYRRGLGLNAGKRHEA